MSDYDFGTMHDFKMYVCNNCTGNDWYCPSDCDFLIKAEKYPLERINKAWRDTEYDLQRLMRRIKSWK